MRGGSLESDEDLDETTPVDSSDHEEQDTQSESWRGWDNTMIPEDSTDVTETNAAESWESNDDYQNSSYSAHSSLHDEESLQQDAADPQEHDEPSHHHQSGMSEQNDDESDANGQRLGDDDDDASAAISEESLELPKESMQDVTQSDDDDDATAAADSFPQDEDASVLSDDAVDAPFQADAPQHVEESTDREGAQEGEDVGDTAESFDISEDASMQSQDNAMMGEDGSDTAESFGILEDTSMQSHDDAMMGEDDGETAESFDIAEDASVQSQDDDDASESVDSFELNDQTDEGEVFMTSIELSKELAELDRVVNVLKADIPRVLRKDPDWKIFAQDFKVVDATGATLERLGSGRTLFELLRRIRKKFALTADIQCFYIDGRSFDKPFDPRFIAKWKVQKRAWELPLVEWLYEDPNYPIDIEAETIFHLNNNNQVDYMRVSKLLVNGQEFQEWRASSDDSFLDVAVLSVSYQTVIDDFAESVSWTMDVAKKATAVMSAAAPKYFAKAFTECQKMCATFCSALSEFWAAGERNAASAKEKDRNDIVVVPAESTEAPKSKKGKRQRKHSRRGLKEQFEEIQRLDKRHRSAVVEEVEEKREKRQRGATSDEFEESGSLGQSSIMKSLKEKRDKRQRSATSEAFEEKRDKRDRGAVAEEFEEKREKRQRGATSEEFEEKREKRQRGATSEEFEEKREKRQRSTATDQLEEKRDKRRHGGGTEEPEEKRDKRRPVVVATEVGEDIEYMEALDDIIKTLDGDQAKFVRYVQDEYLLQGAELDAKQRRLLRKAHKRKGRRRKVVDDESTSLDKAQAKFVRDLQDKFLRLDGMGRELDAEQQRFVIKMRKRQRARARKAKFLTLLLAASSVAVTRKNMPSILRLSATARQKLAPAWDKLAKAVQKFIKARQK